MPYYEIIATMPPDTTKEQCEKMLQNLLIERFHLVFHYDTMRAAGYDLVADKGGIKLRESHARDGDGTHGGASLRQTQRMAPIVFPCFPGRGCWDGGRPLTSASNTRNSR